MKKLYRLLGIVLICAMVLTGCQQSYVDSKVGGTPGVREDMGAKQEENLQWDLIPMVRIEDELFFDTNQVITEARCGVMDGEITSEVPGTEEPIENNQSNFGKGFGYQWAGDGKVDVLIDGKWSRFEARREEPVLAHPVSLCIQDFTPTGVTFILENETEEEMMYGDAFTVQVLRDGQWEDVAYTQAVAFHDIGYNLPAQCITESITLDWSKFYGVLPDGQYRIVKDIYTEDGEITVEDSFELVDGQHVKVSHYQIAKLDKQQQVMSEKEIVDEQSMEVIAQAIFNVILKSARFEIDTSGVEAFYRVTSVYTNDETSDMLFYEVDGIAYGDGSVCDEALYDAMVALVK